uniref:Secreted luciferase n=1 Tax=Pleuromamma abdominalis TaxID=503033 RepID=H3JS11_9MAXI|nr:secreted luciferase [Pleuromamma abdominalis]
MYITVLLGLTCLSLVLAQPTENKQESQIEDIDRSTSLGLMCYEQCTGQSGLDLKCYKECADFTGDRNRGRKLPGKKLPLEVLKIMEANARRAGCTRGCLICLSKIKCTAKMKQYIPGRCHTYEGDKSIGQGGIGGPIVDIPEIIGFQNMEPMEQFIAQVDLCADCTTGCLKGLANVRCNDLLKKWLPDRCAGFANKIQSEVDNIKGLAGDR